MNILQVGIYSKRCYWYSKSFRSRQISRVPLILIGNYKLLLVVSGFVINILVDGTKSVLYGLLQNK